MDRSSPITYLTATTRTASANGLTVMDGCFPAGLRIPAHYHEGPTLAVILQGSFEEHLSTRSYECRAGLFVVKPPGETHRDAFAARGRAIAVEISAERVAHLGSFVPRDALYAANGEAYDLACRIACELRGAGGADSTLALEGLALELIAASIRRRETPGRTGPSWLRRFVDMLHDAPCELPTIAAMGQVVDVHPVYLARVFKTYYHQSLGVYARQLRLRWAANQLTSTNRPVAAIAQQAGFYDQSHFSRAFSAALGFTPSLYRQLFGRQEARCTRDVLPAE
jgi:AraC family transcriptional regulator